MILSWLCCGNHAIAHYILLRPDGIAVEKHRELVSRGGVGPDVPLLMREVASQSPLKTRSSHRSIERWAFRPLLGDCADP